MRDETEMVFLGFVVFMDPPKKTAPKSIALLKQSQVELKILTGDNEIVTKHACEKLGLEVKRIVTGPELARVNDEALSRIVEQANIFARVIPSQKDRVINALKNNGHVVGYLGDGINDAASLRMSDVGISVNNAVDVAKESADIILVHKDLTVLRQGILEGRKTFANTMKYVMMGTSSNFGNMFSAAGASIFLSFLPMLPRQILLNNLLYDLSELAIPTDNVDSEYLERPRKWDVSFIKEFMAVFGPVSSLFDFLTFFVMIVVFHAGEALFQTAWFLESLSTQTLVIFAIRTSKVPFYKSRPSMSIMLASLGIVGFSLLLPYTILGPVFGFVRPPVSFLMILAVFAGSYLALAEFAKRWFYRWTNRRTVRSNSLATSTLMIDRDTAQSRASGPQM
jgi:Mg2+-importing ATPase